MQPLNVFGYKFARYDGYGSYVQNTIRALSRAGVDVMPGEAGVWELPGWIQRLQGWDFGRLTLSIMPGHCMKPLPGRHWLLTMTEDTSCPDDWPDAINRAGERLIVPCQQNADAFKARGVKLPIHVIPGGVNPEEFPVVENRRNQPYTFMALADRGNRKGFISVHHAFYKAFQGVKDVRLIIKSRAETMPGVNLSSVDKRVTFWRANIENPADVYAHADCYVFPSSGEGWGLPPREAAMMGLPVLATRWGGLEDGLDNWAIPLERISLVPSTLGHPGGEWAFVDVDEVAEKMRWCYENQDAARAKGLAAAAWLRENQTWAHSAAALLKLMETYA